MAPRLSRWISMTAVASALVAVMFLTTGGTPLLFLGYGEIDRGEREHTHLQRQIDGVQASLNRVGWRLEAARERIGLDAALRRTLADPAVFRWEGDHLVPDPAAAAGLRPLWDGLAARDDKVRTVVILGGESERYRGGPVVTDSAGLCLIRSRGTWTTNSLVRAQDDLPREVRRIGGECLFAERFGPPGDGIARWRWGVGPGLAWDHGNSDWMMRRWLYEVENTAPAWFTGSSADPWRDGGGWRFRPIGRSQVACLAGRAGQCEIAMGVTPSGWPREGELWGYVGRRVPSTLLPRDLLTAVGTDRFARIWASGDPIATSYHTVTGTAMDGWLGDWARSYLGPVQRDNGLSLLGGVGALLWLGLFGLLTRERLRQRSVT